MAARLDGMAFSQLSDKDARWATDRIIITGAALYGCPMPHTEFLATAISEQITIFFNENYPQLSLAEIILALMLNVLVALKFPSDEDADPIPFYGSQFNVMFLSKIIYKYMIFRKELDSKLYGVISRTQR